ncbi:MAG: hypothetical protein HZB75_03015 [Candidatus Saccharibacteria bacterium]|jgi:hypothetical protein|nr:MAG: hypothetical protein HZB75_03015 [Candidatus Saccharibacteria bacterium]
MAVLNPYDLIAFLQRMRAYGQTFTVKVTRRRPRGHRIELLNGDVHEIAETEVGLNDMLDILWICYGNGGRRMARALRHKITTGLSVGEVILHRRNDTLEE